MSKRETIQLKVMGVSVLVFVLIMSALAAQARNTQDIATLDLQSLLEKVVLGASKHQETLEETPANAFIINRYCASREH